MVAMAQVKNWEEKNIFLTRRSRVDASDICIFDVCGDAREHCLRDVRMSSPSRPWKGGRAVSRGIAIPTTMEICPPGESFCSFHVRLCLIRLI